MTKFIRVAITPLAIAALLAGCGKKDQPASDGRQVELAPSVTAQPQLGDTAMAASPADAPAPPSAAQPAPKAAPKTAARPAQRPATTASAGAASAPAAATAPAAAPAPATATSPEPVRPATGIIAGGLALATNIGVRVCTNTHSVGDRVTGSLATAIPGTNGATIPAGAAVTLRVTESQRGENGKEGVRLTFEPVAVTFGGSTYAISGAAAMTGMETVRAQTTGDQTKKVATGAVIGAIAGQLLGKRAKSAAVGAAVGAAAGGAVAVGSADWNGCLGEGGRVTVTLSAPVTVKVVGN